jgi:NADPH:quinone reductase-like Zn-dependent oxidoreductase
MVRAVVAGSYGGPEVIEVIEVESRPAGDGEVVIAVRAAALNPYDGQQARGEKGRDPDKLPLRLGSEASGVVTSVGERAIGVEGDELRVGDEVFGQRLSGAQASELTVPADRLVRKPRGVGFPQAASLLLTGTTAVHGLEAVRLAAGETLLLHGASGGVGTLVAQLAVLRGARVIGTASSRRFDELRALGVEPVAYGGGLADRVRELAPHGVDAAFDAAGTDEALEVSLELLGDPGRLVTIVNFTAVLAAGGQAIGGGPGADPGREIRAAALVPLTRLLGEGRIRVDVAATLPLESAADAYRLLETGNSGGKVVLEP